MQRKWEEQQVNKSCISPIAQNKTLNPKTKKKEEKIKHILQSIDKIIEMKKDLLIS